MGVRAGGLGSEGGRFVAVTVCCVNTNAPAETAQWIKVFTQHISTARYKHQQEELSAADGSGFCMDAGQVRSGEDKRDKI